MEEKLAGLITGKEAQAAFGRCSQHIQKPGIVGLSETMENPSDQPAAVQLPPQGLQLAAGPTVKDRLDHTQGSPQSGDHTANGGDLHMTGSTYSSILLVDIFIFKPFNPHRSLTLNREPWNFEPE